MFRNISLSFKLILIVVFPLIGFLWFATLHVIDNYHTLREMEQTQEASTAARTFSQLITVLQRERGASGVFLASKGMSMRDVLIGLRQQTDKAINAARRLPALENNQVRQATAALDSLQTIRSQIDALALNNRESGARFTKIIESLIAYTHALQRSVKKPELARSLSSLNQFIEMKERAGRERATLGVVFNQNRVDSDLLSIFSRNLGEFSAYAEAFRSSADAAYVRQLDDKMAAADGMEVARLQRLIFDTPIGQSLDVSAESWFKLSTARIDQMSDVENALSLHIRDLANQEHVHAYFVLCIVLASVGGAVVAVVLLSSLIIRNIRTAVREVNSVLIALSERDLTSRATYVGRDEFGTIASNLNRTATELSQIIQEIGTATAQVATAAEEASAVTLQTSQSLVRQRQGTELVVTAINEMSATVRDVAQSTGDAATLSQQVNQSTEKGRKEIEATVRVIQDMSEQADETAVIIGELKSESDSISTVLDVIRGIAEQTNLLALNAAIEAARAGDHGRGFAVVATEVRTLAQRTQESTGNIQDMITKLQAGSDRATSSMKETLSKTRTGASNIERAGELLAEIAVSVSSISDRNMQIATAAEQQSAVAEDINRNVMEINDVAIQVSAGADQTAATSQELARLAEHQQVIVSRFKLN
ncbi:methyl-accepting chemotaxis protein [Pseudomonas sp. R1-7]